jgi:hypothetical protein
MKVPQVQNSGSGPHAQVRRAMVERVLARLCTALSIRDVSADVLFAELDTDGSGELDAEELQQACRS